MREAGAGAPEGSTTGAVAGRAAAGGSGELGSWMGAVALLAMDTGPVLFMGIVGGRGAGEVGTRAVAAPAGVTEVVMGRGTGVVLTTGGTGAVISFGCVIPAPGRARRVMRTVSFLSGTAAVFCDGDGGGVGCVLLSLMMQKFVTEAWSHRVFQKRLAFFVVGSQWDSPVLGGSFAGKNAVHAPMLEGIDARHHHPGIGGTLQGCPVSADTPVRHLNVAGMGGQLSLASPSPRRYEPCPTSSHHYP